MKRLIYLIYFLIIALPLFLLSTLLCALVSGLGSAFISQRFFAYYPGMIWSRFTLAIFFMKVKIEGKEHIPKDRKGCIVIANHQSALDIFLLYAYIGLPFRWLLKGSLRKVPFVGWACYKCGFIFVDNTSVRNAGKNIEDAELAFRNGYSIFIFPEGSRTPTGKIQRFKKGAFKIAMDTDAALLPIGINGAYEALPKMHLFPYPRTLTLRIGEPFTPEAFERSPKGLIKLCRKGDEAIRGLTNEIYH